LKPSDVFYTWESCEVLVTYGILMNRISVQNFVAYEDSKRDKPKPPGDKYFVKFIDPKSQERIANGGL